MLRLAGLDIIQFSSSFLFPFFIRTASSQPFRSITLLTQKMGKEREKETGARLPFRSETTSFWEPKPPPGRVDKHKFFHVFQLFTSTKRTNSSISFCVFVIFSNTKATAPMAQRTSWLFSKDPAASAFRFYRYVYHF